MSGALNGRAEYQHTYADEKSPVSILLKVDMRALCLLEEKFGISLTDEKDAEKMLQSLSGMRNLIHATWESGRTENKEQRKCTLDVLYYFIDEVGLVEIMKPIAEILNDTQGDEPEVQDVQHTEVQDDLFKKK